MGAMSIVLLVAFVIICALLVLLVLIQDEDNSGMGGLLGGGNTAAFGSHSASVLTKATCVLVVLFLIAAFGLALLNKKPSAGSDLAATAAENGQKTSQSAQSVDKADWWKANTPSQETPADGTQSTVPAESAPPAESVAK
jgi:preprotein translocase subunit SecG